MSARMGFRSASRISIAQIVAIATGARCVYIVAIIN